MMVQRGMNNLQRTNIPTTRIVGSGVQGSAEAYFQPLIGGVSFPSGFSPIMALLTGERGHAQ